MMYFPKTIISCLNLYRLSIARTGLLCMKYKLTCLAIWAVFLNCSQKKAIAIAYEEIWVMKEPYPFSYPHKSNPIIDTLNPSDTFVVLDSFYNKEVKYYTIMSGNVKGYIFSNDEFGLVN